MEGLIGKRVFSEVHGMCEVPRGQSLAQVLGADWRMREAEESSTIKAQGKAAASTCL